MGCFVGANLVKKIGMTQRKCYQSIKKWKKIDFWL